jgi:DNA-binding response OmpR family regulator
MDIGRILVVDDNPTNIDVLHDFLSDLGYEVLVAEDGTSALDRIRYVKPDLLLLDIMMPHLDGYGVAKILRENPATADIPVIYITALGSIEDKMKGFDTGAVDYITKPFQNQEVLARVRTHLALRRMRKDLELNNEKLRTQNEALDAYARSVAHDLKNPLNLILNFARLIEEENVLAGVNAEDLRNIILSAERMNHIIHDLLLLAQMRQEEIHPVRVNMKAVIRHSLDRLHTDLHKVGAEVIEPARWPDCEGVASWLQAVWVNYMSNAIKYGGNPPKIELFWEKDPQRPGFLRYGVKDNGVGIPSGKEASVFEEFSRVGGEKTEGHGIGLSIVRRVVQRLDGNVGVYNLDPGPGCAFYFSLKESKNP